MSFFVSLSIDSILFLCQALMQEISFLEDRAEPCNQNLYQRNNRWSAWAVSKRSFRKEISRSASGIN